MRHETTSGAALLAALCALTAPAPAFAQYREYLVRGRVVDTQKQPLAGVEIRLLDVATSRSFHMKSDGQGAFKFAGLPHGVYQATFEKDGYTRRQEEWKFEAQQDRMQKVEVPDVVLVSEAVVQQKERAKEAEADVKAAGEKLRAGELDAAIALLRGVLDRNPDDAHALFLLGLSYTRKSMYREAVEALTRVTQLTPTFAGAWFELGVCQRELGEPEKALAAYEKSLELDPANADAAYNAGLVLFQANRIDEALVRFEKGLASKPQDPDLLEMAARCCLNQARYAAALAYLEQAREHSSDPAKRALLDKLIESTRAQVR